MEPAPIDSPEPTAASVGRAGVGHPVDIATGEQFTACSDIKLPGAVPLTFRRFYSTRLLTLKSSSFGPGWIPPFAATLTRDLDGYTLVAHDGRTIVFDDYDGDLDRGGAVLSRGNFTEITRRRDHMVVTHWHPGGSSVQRFGFKFTDAPGPALLEWLEDPAGHRIQCFRDAEGRIAQVWQALEQRRLLVLYRQDGLVGELQYASATSQPIPWARYDYDASGRLATVTDQTGQAIRYGYDAYNRLTEEVSRTGGRYRFEYDAAGRCVLSEGDQGYKRRQLSYQAAERLTLVTDSAGQVTEYRYNRSGQVTACKAPSGATRSFAYDDWGRLVTEIDALARATRHRYDQCGNRIETKAPGGATTRWEYNSDHQVVARTDPTGKRWSWRYENGSLMEMTDPLGSVYWYKRDERGLVSEAHAPNGHVAWFKWDAKMRFQMMGDSEGAWRLEFDAVGRVSGLYDPEGLVQRTFYDETGRPSETQECDGNFSRFQHDAHGRVIWHRDQNGGEWNYRYNPYGDLMEATDPLGYKIRPSYDLEGKLKTLVNQNGEVYSISRNVDGHVVEQHFFDGRVERYRRDAEGQLVWQQSPDGSVTEFRYDELGRLAEVKRDDGWTETFTHDLEGRLILAANPDVSVTFQRDAYGRVEAEVQTMGLQSRKIECEYNSMGRLIARHYVGGQAGRLTYEYDLRNRLAAFRDAAGVIQCFRYDALDRVVERRFVRSTTETRRYDIRGRLAAQQVSNGAICLDRSYQYDGTSKLVEIADQKDGTENFEYDARGRISRHAAKLWGSATYVYDGAGNILTSPGGDSEYGTGNRLARKGATEYSYDDNSQQIAKKEFSGRVTQYEYDRSGQLIGVKRTAGSTAKYTYDPLGRRVMKDLDGIKTRFVWLGDSLVAEETEGRSTEWVLQRFCPLASKCGGNWSGYVSGHRGEVLMAVNQRGRVSWSGRYGLNDLLEEEGDSNPWRLLGQYRDPESDLCYSRFRYFDPVTGRFIMPDPLRMKGGLNEFQYAPDPINYVDPWGLECGGRKDYRVGTQDEAVARACQEAGIDPEAPTTQRVYDPETGELIGYKDGKREVHFHPSDLAGHDPATVGNDPAATAPHVNYSDWTRGKAHGVYGHVNFGD